MENPDSIIKFWFEEIEKDLQFKKDKDLDEKIKSRFGELLEKAKQGELDSWKQSAESTFALIILLDQFSRNIYRDDKKSFEADKLALNIAKEGIEKGFDKQIDSKRRAFFYIPFMHSENIEDQKKAIELFEELSKEHEGANNNVKYAIMHKDIIEKFNRFPHRNKILGRKSTEEEIDFLKTSGSSF